VIVSAAVAVLALSVGGYFYFHRTPKLTDKDTIVLADFMNTTGDPVFDGTLRQGMAVQLEQSPFLSLVSDERIQQVLRLMGKPSRRAAYPRGRSGSLRANRKRRRPGRLDRKPRKPVRLGVARKDLPHRGRPR